MKKFKLPVEWAVFATVEIEAETIDDAIKYFNENIDDIPLPEHNDDECYIDGSFQLSGDDIEYIKAFQD